MLRRRPFSLLLLAAGLFSCVELPTIEEDRCGNGFIEPGEDCDVFDTKKMMTGATCNPAGTPNECHFKCASPDDCLSALGSSARCGVDKVCRQPKGSAGGGTFFTPASSLIPGIADDLFTGDFDGDGRKDILAVGQAGFDIHYFTGEGSVAKSLHIPGAPVTPAIGKLTTTIPDTDAFTLDVGQGIGVMLGRAGQTIEPKSYLSLDVKNRYQSPPDSAAPDNMRLLLVDTGATMKTMGPPGPRLGPGPLALSATDGIVTLIDAAIEPMGKVILGMFPELAAKMLLGTIPVAFPKPGADRQLFLLAFQDEKSVYVMDAGASKQANIKSQIDLPSGFRVHGASFFVDVNGDGFTDVLVGAADCAKGATPCNSAEIDVAYGSGDGSFYAKPGPAWDQADLGKAATYRNVYPNGAPPPPPDSTPSLSIAEIELYLPLAVGRFNLDLDVDYVNAFGIYVSNAGNQLSCSNVPNGYCQVDRSSGGQLWSEVKVGDFNANDRLDVVAVTRGTKGIDFFNGTGVGIFNTFSIPTDGVPTNLAVGDFDGDFLHDLAFDSVSSKMSKEVHTLFVTFGQPTGAPALPVSMGEVANLLQIVPGNLSSFGNDAASEIVLLSGIPARPEGTKKIAGKDWKVGLSQGNGYRQLQAPLIFFAPDSITIDASPLASAIGFFDDDDGAHADVAAVVQSYQMRDDNKMGGRPPFCDLKAAIWVLPATDDAMIAPPADDSKSITIATSSSKLPDNFLPIRELVEAVPIRIGKETTDQLLIAFPTYTGKCTADLNGISAHGQLLLANLNPTDGTAAKIQVVNSSQENTFLLRLHLGDVDGDQKLDIVALQAVFNFANGQIGTSVVVLRGDDKGGFKDPVTLEVGGAPVDLALVNTNDDSTLEIVVVSDAKKNGEVAQLSVFAWDNTKKEFDPLLPSAVSVADVAASGSLALDQPSALVGGDFDGDGVDDVAVAVSGGIQMFKGIAK